MATTANELMSRRVPHLSAVYLGVGWGLVQFVSFVEDRYLISPYWTDISLLLLALLLPSALLFTWNHGRPGKDALTGSEKVLIPVNVILAAIVITTLFSGRDLGAVTMTITLEDDEGETIERVVPKSEFRKRLGLFAFDVPDGGDLEWASRSFEAALAQDLQQDLFVDVRFTPFYEERPERAGFLGGLGVPFGLKREIAQEQNREHFVEGALEPLGEGWRATYTLYETDRGKALENAELEAEDLLALADIMSLHMREALEIPSRHIEETADLPVAEIFAGDTAAVRAYGQAIHTLLVDRDFAAADALLAEAVTHDPAFAVAHLSRYGLALLNNNQAVAMPSLQAAVANSYRLPERDRFQVNAEMHLMQQRRDQALAAYEMKAELFPDDIKAHLGLAMVYQLGREERRAIASLERVLEIDPGQTEYLSEIGEMYQGLGEYDEARSYFDRFAEAFPDDPRSAMSLAGLHRILGQHEEARGQLDRALALEPTNVGNAVALARLLWSTGQFEDAESQLQSIQAMAQTPPDRVTALGGVQSYYEFRGQTARALERAREGIEESAAFMPAFMVSVQRMVLAELVVAVGDTAVAERMLEEVAAELQGPFASFVDLGRLMLAIELERPDEIDAAIVGVEQVIEAFGFEIFRPAVVGGRARAAELRDDFEGAIAEHRALLELEPTRSSARVGIGRGLRELGRLEEAEQELAEALRIQPFSPRTNLEMALVLIDMGRDPQALERLQRAESVWADADAGHRWAGVVRETLAEIEGS